MIPRRFFLAALAVVAACDSAGTDRIIEIDATGTVGGALFLDLDASGTPGPEDVPATNRQLALVRVATNDTVAVERTDEEGVFVFDAVPVGTYDVVVIGAALGDSLRVVYRDPPGSRVEDIGPGEVTSVTVGANDSVDVLLGLSYFTYTVEEARSLPVGRRVFVRGNALAPIDAIDDDALYLQGQTHAIRITGAAGPLLTAGDSILVLGTTGVTGGQPVLANGIARATGFEGQLDSVRVLASSARNAGGGDLDAQLVDLREAIVSDTATVGNRFTFTVADPTGTVDVVVPTSFGLTVIAPGREVDVTGLLVPAPGVASTWQIRPRSAQDVRLQP